MEVKKFYPRVFILITLMFFVYNGQASANSIYTNNANNKIDHLIWSLQNNYLGIKNQAQWEIYIKEARYIIANIPISEKSKAEYLTSKLEKGKSLVEGTASINQLEKSMETNYHGIKNAKQWRGYISFSEKYLSRVDKSLFSSEYKNILNRLNKCKETILSIENKFQEDYLIALERYYKARETMLIYYGEKALEDARLLGTCKESDELEKKCESLIYNIRTLSINIKSLTIDNNTYDDDKSFQKIPLKVNDEIINIDFLKTVGYSVEFIAKDKIGNYASIFEEGYTSTTGRLINPLSLGEYKISITLTKDNHIISSNNADIRVINMDIPVTKITGYTMENIRKGEKSNNFIQESSTLVVGEIGKILSLNVINDSSDYKVYNNITIESDNEAVIHVDPNRVITALSKGSANITLSYNGLKKVIIIQVTDKARIATTAIVEDRVSIVSTKSISKEVSIKDQYNDPYKEEVEIKLQDKDKVIERLSLDYLENRDKRLLHIKTSENQGIAAIYIVDLSGKVLKDLEVIVSEINNVNSLKMEIENKAYNKEFSDDLVIFPKDYLYDKYIKFSINQYNSKGIYNGKMNLKGCFVRYDEKLLSIEGVTDNYFIDGTSFRILGRMIGESDIAIYGENKQLILKFRVKVEDYRNNIIDVKWNELENIDYIGETLNIFSVLDITRSFNDHVINKITLENNRNHKIRIKKDAYNSDECSIEAGDLYIDKDGNGRFSKEDIIIGKIKGKVIDKENIADINIFEEIPTEKGDKFVVVYTLYGYDKKTNSLDKILSTKAISVDV